MTERPNIYRNRDAQGRVPYIRLGLVVEFTRIPQNCRGLRTKWDSLTGVIWSGWKNIFLTTLIDSNIAILNSRHNFAHAESFIGIPYMWMGYFALNIIVTHVYLVMIPKRSYQNCIIPMAHTIIYQCATRVWIKYTYNYTCICILRIAHA